MELSEEEKDAIETIEFLKKKKWYKYAGDNGTVILDEDEKKDVDIVLNLINKQQKEIEELKEKNTQLTNYLNDSYYVSADKIREKIKKAKEIKWHTPKLVIEYFEELLEEN